MFKLISIDPGKCKCGLVLVDLHQKKVDQAIVLNTEFLPNYVKTLNSNENISKVLTPNIYFNGRKNLIKRCINNVIDNSIKYGNKLIINLSKEKLIGIMEMFKN